MNDPLLCDDSARRSTLSTTPTLHGIDYLEVITAPPADNQRLLDLYFVPKLTAAGLPDPAGIADISGFLASLNGNLEAVRIEGGTRERNVRVLGVTYLPDPTGGRLRIRVDRPGDFSDYTLQLEHPSVDPRYDVVTFSFKAGCPSRFDCRIAHDCPVEARPAPLIDYMARDYASFRRALLDFAPSLISQWREQHEADLGVAIIELYAYVGDYLSYYQDAVANEAYLETARSRISVRRHARLLDYRMHDGASARCFVHFVAGSAGTMSTRTAVTTRIDQALAGAAAPPGNVIGALLKDAALDAADTVFETISDVRIDPRANRMPIYTWGDRDCCLARGATALDLVGDLTGVLAKGDFLLLEEELGISSGKPADADPNHRQVVRLTRVSPTLDPLLTVGGGPPPQPLTHVEWEIEDALRFSLCLSTRLPGEVLVSDVSVARGNIVLADHGRTFTDQIPKDTGPGSVGVPATRRGLRVRLPRGPLSQTYPHPSTFTRQASAQRLQIAAPELLETMVDPCRLDRYWVSPQVNIDVQVASISNAFTPRPDLLDSGPYAHNFVCETEDDDSALLRFGDGVFGAAVPAGARLTVTSRVGLGPAGNIGRDALAHVVDATGLLPAVMFVRNPLAAWGGVAPQPIEQVKRLAPPSIQARQYRAVTEADYARAAETHPAVAKAAATFRWTGSWLTVFITVDPRGGYTLDEHTQADVLDWVECQTQAGYDLELNPPHYVPLEIRIEVCVRHGYFRAQVEVALLERLSSRSFADGRRGFFHPDEFTFGDPLYLSRLYAAADRVTGVESVRITRAQRFGVIANHELERGLIEVGRLEIIRLDNDRSRPENGVITLDMLGGA